MNKKVKTKLKKMLSLFVLNCFLLSYVYGPALANITDGKAMVEKYKNIFNEFMLPYSYGQIIKSHYAGTDRVVINIQDLHCHPKVQKNISNIIELFDKRYGIANIYLEGAYGDVDTQWLLQAVKGDRETADKILQTGRLTGAEYYSAVSGKTTIIKGLEQKDAYFDNLKRFAFIVENQDKINLILEGIKESTKKLKENYYSKRQYRLERLSDSYRKGKISPEKYYILLNKHIDRLGIDIYKYKHTFRYMTLIGLQKELDYKAIGTDLQNFMLLLKEHLSPDLYKMLSDSTDEFSKADKLYGYIRKIARQYDLNLDVNYKNLNKYFKYLELSQQINPFKLVAEEQELSREINTRFSETKAQREAVFLIYFERYLRDYLNSKITVEDYEYYKENIDTYIELWNKYVDNRVLSLLDKYIDEADIFYAINNDRNTYFADNISNGIETSAIEGKKDAEDDTGKIMENIGEVKRIDIIITGGFHTDTVSDILKEKGISYIVITPNVTEGAKKAEDIYYAIAKEQGKISFQTLATLPLSLYGQDMRVRISVESFGRSVSEKIFGERLVRDVLAKDSPMTQDQTAELSQAAQKRQIEFAKILDSDDYGDIDEKITALIKESVSEEHKNKVTRELLEKAKPEDIEKALSAGQKELEALIDLLSEINPIKRLVLSLKFILPDLKPLFGSPEKDFNNLINRYAFITNVKTGRFEMLRFTQTGVYKIINRMDIPVSKSEIDSMGLEIAFDDKGNITNVTAKEGFELSSLLFDGEPQADEKYNLPFTDAQMQAMMQDTGAKGQVDIYLDDDEEVLAKNIADAIRTNSLMVIHIFRKGYNSRSLTLSQLYDRYQKAYSLLQSDKFFLKELLKNHFAHGNHGLFEQPIACYIETNDEGQISEIITYDAGFGVESSWRNTAETLMNSATIFGDHKAHEYMDRSILRNLTRGEVSLNGNKFYRAKSALKTPKEQAKAHSDYDEYLESLSRRTQQDDWNDFLGLQTEDTVSRLYNRGYAKYLRQYLKQTGKSAENLTEEETAGINQKAENYRFTLQGLAYGAFLEIFALWSQDFIDSHNFDSSIRGGMIAVVWVIRALSIGIGLTAAVLSLSALPVSTFLMPIVFTAIFGSTAISSSFVLHLLWNIVAVLTDDKERILNKKSKSGLDEVNNILKTLKKKGISQGEVNKLQNLINNNKDSFDLNLFNPGFITSLRKALFDSKKFGEQDHKNIHDFINKLIKEEYSEIFYFEAQIKDIEKNMERIRKEIEDFNEELKDLEQYIDQLKTLNNAIQAGGGVAVAREICRTRSLGKSSPLYKRLDRFINLKTNGNGNDEQTNRIIQSIKDEIRNAFIYSQRSLDDIKNNTNNEFYKELKDYQDQLQNLRIEKDKKEQQKEAAKIKLQTKLGKSVSQINNEIDRIEKYEEIIKIFSKFYAYIQWNEYKKNHNKDVKKDKDGTEYILLSEGHKLTFEAWSDSVGWGHICDGHSILTNGNEIEGFDRYPDSGTALAAAITLEMLTDGKTVKDITENYDVKIVSGKEKKIKYIKRNKKNQKVYVYIEDSDGKLITCYVIDSKKYSDNIVDNILETIHAGGLSDKDKRNFSEYLQRNNIEILVKRDKKENIRGKSAQKYREKNYRDDIVKDFDVLKSRFIFGHSFEVLKYLEKIETYKKVAQTPSTVEKLEKIGKFFNKENFRYTTLGVAIGVIIETFDFWRSDFIEQHNYDPSIRSGMRAVVWRLRAISIGGGLLTAAAAAIISLNPVSLLAVFPAVILTEWISHFIYNKYQIAQGNIEQLLQTERTEQTITPLSNDSTPSLLSGLREEYNNIVSDESISEEKLNMLIEKVEEIFKDKYEGLKTYTEIKNGKSEIGCDDEKDFKTLLQSLHGENVPLDVKMVICKLWFEGENKISEQDYSKIRKYIHDDHFFDNNENAITIDRLDAEAVANNKKKKKKENVTITDANGKQISVKDIKSYEARIKLVSRMYGYMLFKDNKLDERISLPGLLHMYDGHSILIIGNEIGQPANSPSASAYSEAAKAINAAITVDNLKKGKDGLSLIDKIVNNPEVVYVDSDKNNNYVFQATVNGIKYQYVQEIIKDNKDKKERAVTCYPIGNDDFKKCVKIKSEDGETYYFTEFGQVLVSEQNGQTDYYHHKGQIKSNFSNKGSSFYIFDKKKGKYTYIKEIFINPIGEQENKGYRREYSVKDGKIQGEKKISQKNNVDVLEGSKLKCIILNEGTKLQDASPVIRQYYADSLHPNKIKEATKIIEQDEHYILIKNNGVVVAVLDKNSGTDVLVRKTEFYVQGQRKDIVELVSVYEGEYFTRYRKQGARYEYYDYTDVSGNKIREGDIINKSNISIDKIKKLLSEKRTVFEEEDMQYLKVVVERKPTESLNGEDKLSGAEVFIVMFKNIKDIKVATIKNGDIVIESDFYQEKEEPATAATMSWLSKTLDFFGVTDFEKRQKIVNIVENPIIILGEFSPVIQNWFVRQHKGQNPEAVRKGLAGIVTTALSEADDFVPGSGIAGLAAMLTNKNFRQALDKAHSEHNRRAAEIDVTVTKTDEKSIGLKQTVPYDKNSSKHLVFLIQKSNGDRYSVRIPQDKQTVYLASFNGDAYSRVESEYDSFEKIEELLGVKFEINTDTIDVTDVSGGNIIYYTNADEIERALSKINSRPLQLPSDDELQRVRKNTKTAETVIVYLDGSERENKAKIKDAVDNNKLLVIYPFSVSYDINSLTDYELLILYSDISRKFFDMADILFDMLPKLKDNDFLGLEFFLKEMVKNAFVHGNFSDPSKPIYVDCRKNSISVYNAVSDGRISDMEKQRRLSLSAAATLTGQHRGIARAQKYKDVMSLTQKEIVLGAQEYYVASAVMLGQPAAPAEEKKTADAVKYEEADDKISSKEPEALERGPERTSSESDMNAEELSRENTAGQNAEIGIASLGIPITDIVIITAKRSITPSNAAQEISIKIVNGDQSAVELEKNIANMSSNLIITDSESLAEMLRRQGFKAVTARIVYERGGSRIGQYKGMNVRAKWNKDETEILLCLKELDADVRKEELLKMLLDALSEGIQTNILYGISQVVITNEQTIDGAVEAIKNAHTDSVMKPIKETKFDLSERHMAKNIDIVCKREASATGAQAFILNSLQAQHYQEEISALRQEGFRYVVSYASSGEVGEILYDGAKIDASDIKSISGAKQFLRTLKAKALSKGAGLLMSVKFNDDIYKEFAEQNINVFNEYGIIPVVGADSQYLNAFTLGKIEAEGITEKNVEKILQNDMVVTIVVDDARILNDKKEKLKQVKTKEQKYAKGYNASLNSKFDYTAKDIKELSVLLMADINDEEENLAALWEKMPIDDMTLSQDSKSYIKYLLERKRYEEALGFVRGIAMNSAGKILIAKLAEMKISIDESKFRRVSGGMFQKALLTLLVQLLMEGEDIAALLQDDYTVYGAMTAKEYLESVTGNVNANIENIVNDNEHQIKKISDTAKAIADFKEFNLLLQDMFSETKVIRNVKVSAFAVRNILGAA